MTMPVMNREICLKNREKESFVSILKKRAASVLRPWGRYNEAATTADKANTPRMFLLLTKSERMRIIIAATSNIISGVINLMFSIMFKMRGLRVLV
jgi:hypothetical protein